MFGGFISSVGSALSAVGGAICSGISSVCSAIGGALFSGASGIAALTATVFGPALALPGIVEILIAVQAVCAIVGFIAEALGLKDKEETPEELGMKAEMAEKKPEDFDSISAYIEYLRNDIELDKKKVEQLSDEDRVKYAAIGSGLYIKGIEEKYGIEAPGEFWRDVADLQLKGEEVKAYIETFKANGMESMKDMSDYIRGIYPESGTAPRLVSQSMTDALKKIYPELSEDEICSKLVSMSLPDGVSS